MVSEKLCEQWKVETPEQSRSNNDTEARGGTAGRSNAYAGSKANAEDQRILEKEDPERAGFTEER
jgi:hypothetical protein